MVQESSSNESRYGPVTEGVDRKWPRRGAGVSSRLGEGKRRSSVLDQPAPSLALTVAVLRTSHQK